MKTDNQVLMLFKDCLTQDNKEKKATLHKIAHLVINENKEIVCGDLSVLCSLMKEFAPKDLLYPKVKRFFVSGCILR